MSTNTITPNMSLTNPTPGVESGPAYATDISGDLVIIDGHTHTGASNSDGLQIPTAGLNINADLSFQSNNLTSVRSTRFDNQSLVLNGSSDIGVIYQKLGDLWYNNSAGTPVQITSGGTVLTLSEIAFNEQIVTGNITLPSNSLITYLNVQLRTSVLFISLPAANAVPRGRYFYIKDDLGRAATHTITILAAGTDTLDGAASYVILENYASVLIVSDGAAQWDVLPYNRKVLSAETLSLNNGSALVTDATSTVTLGGTLSVTGLTTLGNLSVTGLSTLTGGVLSGNNITYASALSNPTLSQADLTTNSGSGQALTIHAQNETGTTSNGGNLILKSGTGTNSDGIVAIFNGTSANFAFGTTLNTMNVPSLTWGSGVASPSLSQGDQISNAPTNTITITGQAAYASASGANRTPGSINLAVTVPTNSGTVRGKINLLDGSNTFLSFNADSTGTKAVLGSVAISLNTSAFINLVTPALSLNGSTVGLYTTSPIVQPSRVGQLTNYGGAPTPTTSIADVTGLFSQSITNQNFTNLLTKINAIEVALSGAGGGIGVTA